MKMNGKLKAYINELTLWSVVAVDMKADKPRLAMAGRALDQGYMLLLEDYMPLPVQDYTVLLRHIPEVGCTPDLDNSCCFYGINFVVSA